MGIFLRSFRLGASLLGLFLFCSGNSAYPADSQMQANGKIEVNIRNSTYEFQGGILKTDQPALIVIHNLDRITHGFTSTLIEDLDTQIESSGVTTLGKGIKAIHIDSGKTARIQFIPNRSGRFTFRCDLHPNMKGELLILSIESI